MASKEEPTQDQGYPLEQFLEEIPDKYKCICCYKVAREIHMIECCRKQACLSCIKQYLNNQACPQCQEKDFSIVSLKKDNEKIANLLVKCAEKGKGCEWIGKLKELDDHLHKEEDGCRFSPRECPKCQKPINRCEMANHLEESCPNRDYNCPHCGFQDTYDFVTRAHMPECSNYPVSCPNPECGVTCERNDIDYHLRERCEEQFIDCEYKHAGCDVKYRRKNKDEHMNLYQEKHRTMYEVHTVKLTEKWQQIHEEMLQFQEKQKQTMTESEQRAQELEKKITKLEQMMVTIEQENKQKGEEIEKLRQKVNQLERKLQDQERRFDHQIQLLKLGVSHHDQHNQPDTTHTFKPEQQETKAISSIAPHQLGIANPCMFTIDKFAERKANEENWESPVMITPRGYKLLLEVWPSGKYEGRDTHVSVWVHYIREDGEETKWPARVTMNLELLRQEKAPQNTRKAIFMESFNIQCDQYTSKRRYNLIGKFSNTLVSHKTLDENQLFLKDDSLKMKVTLLNEQPIGNDNN